jgi:hypothetical protein
MYREIMLRNKSIFQISTLICLNSISICNLRIELPSYNDIRFKTYEKRPLNMHLKVKRPDTPLVKGKRKRSGANLISSMLWLNPRSVSKPPDNMLSLFGKCPQREWKPIKLWTALFSK